MVEQRIQRRLAAIAVADVVAYSRLMEADEAGTLTALRERRKTILEPVVRDHGGRIFKVMGDGVLVEFASAVNAVAGALELQRNMAEANAALPEKLRIVLRIGINLGDVVGDGADIYGDGVNIAARLEALADPGGLCISGKVHDEVLGKIDVVFEDSGEQTLKNIVRPVRVWRWSEGTAAQPPSLPLPDRPSIAVLPFDNLSGEAEETLFSDGITEDIITGLARFRSLFVVARNSSFAFRGKPVSLIEIGRQLGVSYLLEGSVRRLGDRIRITAQLIEAASGAHVWAERYDRGLTEIFAMQDEVATTIVSTLVGRIGEAKLQQSLRKPTDSLEAYDFVLRGLAHFRGHADNANQQACAMFEKAIGRDPRYALAHSYLALARVVMNGFGAAPASIKAASRAMASNAVELDPQDGSCRRILGHILLTNREYDLAEHHARRAVDLNPNDADCAVSLGYLLVMRGDPSEGLGWIDKAMRLDPFYPPWYNAQRAAGLYSLKRFSEAEQALKRYSDPGGWSTRRAACYGQLGMAREAEVEAAAILRAVPDFSTGEFMSRTVLLERSEDRELLRQGLIKAGLPE